MVDCWIAVRRISGLAKTQTDVFFLHVRVADTICSRFHHDGWVEVESIGCGGCEI